MFVLLFFKNKFYEDWIERIILEIIQRLGDPTKIKTVEYFSRELRNLF